MGEPKPLAVRVYDLGKIQMARLRFDEDVPMLELADPPNDTGAMQWMVITGREELTRLAHGILEFLIDYPDRGTEDQIADLEEGVNRIPTVEAGRV